MLKSQKAHKIPEYIKENSEKFRSFRRFLRGINSIPTRDSYTKNLKIFMNLHKLENFDDVAAFTTKEIDEHLEDWIDFMAAKDVKGGTIRTDMCGIERFFMMNDCIWHKDRIRASIKKDSEEKGGKVPVTTEELQKMLKCTKSLRTMAIVHFLASTGCRPGALIDPVLRQKHLLKLEDYYAIRVYDGDEAGYWAFLTPEASRALDDYTAWRKLKGETIEKETPLFGIVDKRNAKSDYLTDKSLRWILTLLVQTAGIERTKVTDRRYDKAIIYMFRKRFNTILKINNDVNSNIAEKLMAHSKGLDGTYLQPTMDECFNEFVKATSDLTVDPTKRQEQLIKKQNREINLLEKKTRKIDQLEQMVIELRNKESVPPSEEMIEKVMTILKNQNRI